MTPSQYNAHCFCMFLSCWNLPKTDWIIWWLLICSSFLWKMVMPDSWLLITILIIQKTSQFFGVNEETFPKNHPAKNLLFSQLGQVPSLKLTARTWNGMILQEPLPKHTSRPWRRRCTTPRCRSRCGSRGCSRSCRMHRVVGQEQIHILGQAGKKKSVFNAQYSTGRLRSRDHWNDHFPRDDCPRMIRVLGDATFFRGSKITFKPKHIFSRTPEGLFENDFPIGFLGPSFFLGEGVHGIIYLLGIYGAFSAPFQCHVSLQEIIWRSIVVS